MTLIIGNNTIKINWWKAIALMFTFSVALVTTTWGLSNWIGGFKNEIVDLSRNVKELKVSFEALSKTQAPYFKQTEANTVRIDSVVKNSCCAIPVRRRPTTIVYVTETKDANGNVTPHRVRNN